ncbi:MAG: Enoyl-CoA hydratase/carnithine racemase [Hydrocarboniphaga sp.]|uniref:enoyl-CoA hydratase n=1 Tax=Hydrocarboniphaga sp. TaxID=2033016 RepID=UPI002613FAB1|nr:enoyl-CoA hydratase [Hydrocarboniphaga sp.]MDB5972759.1 Enoyl-CoA hydratase/carnithine racemase [Hydrocarboniphaga sp.]
MSEQHIVTEIQDAVMTIRLNRADKKNALTSAMYEGLTAGFKAAAADPAVRVVLLTGSGDAFSSGNDLADFLKNTPTDAANSPVMLFMAAMSQFPKPIVAAVNGLAIGVGVTMLLHCDLVYASAKARFQMPFTNIGICPEFGSTLLLPAMMGHQRAAELTMLGEAFDAEKAKEAGIVNALVSEAELKTFARDQALKLASQPPNALRTTKALLKRWPQAALIEAIRVEAEHFMPMLKMPEALEAMGAFMQKRKPDFSQFS